MGKRCGLIDGNNVLMDRVYRPDFDEGTIWTNLSNNELCIKVDGEKKLIRIDAGTGIGGTQRVLTRVERASTGNELIIFFVDLTIVDGVVTEATDEDSYNVEHRP